MRFTTRTTSGRQRPANGTLAGLGVALVVALLLAALFVPGGLANKSAAPNPGAKPSHRVVPVSGSPAATRSAAQAASPTPSVNPASQVSPSPRPKTFGQIGSELQALRFRAGTLDRSKDEVGGLELSQNWTLGDLTASVLNGNVSWSSHNHWCTIWTNASIAQQMGLADLCLAHGREWLVHAKSLVNSWGSGALEVDRTMRAGNGDGALVTYFERPANLPLVDQTTFTQLLHLAYQLVGTLPPAHYAYTTYVWGKTGSPSVYVLDGRIEAIGSNSAWCELPFAISDMTPQTGQALGVAAQIRLANYCLAHGPAQDVLGQDSWHPGVRQGVAPFGAGEVEYLLHQQRWMS